MGGRTDCRAIPPGNLMLYGPATRFSVLGILDDVGNLLGFKVKSNSSLSIPVNQDIT